MNWMDYHLHTADSADSAESMKRMCRRAVEQGLDEICFTEHYDTDPYDPGYGFYDDTRCERRLKAARKSWGARLTIRKGLEFDFQSRYAGRTGELLAPYRFDFLLGSVHNVFGGTPRRAICERGFPPDEVYRYYFEETRTLIASGLPHCIGHLDYVRKTCWDVLEGYRYADYEGEMADVVDRLVAAGIGLEVNTRHRDAGAPIVPGPDVLRMYRRAGGRVITLGSDAHRAAGLGAGFAEAVEMIREAGFREQTAFEDGRPQQRRLPEV